MPIERRNRTRVQRSPQRRQDAHVEVGPHAPLEQRRTGVVHLIECTCMLPQYIRREVPVFHRFVVFSVVEPDDSVVEKFAQCNNCGIVHRVVDICRSEVVFGKDESRGIVTVADVRSSLPQRIVDVLDANDCDVYVWEHARFIVEEERWGEHVTLSSDVVDGRRIGKFMVIAGPDKLGVSQYSENIDFSTSR